jgi:nucleoside-diphosphate-sugar epimerase
MLLSLLPIKEIILILMPLFIFTLFFIGTPQHVVNFTVKLNPFAVKMLMINRYFDISAAKKDLKYEPLIEFEQGWASTIDWFKIHWLPKYLAEREKAKNGSNKKQA